ncbi:variable surface protein [Plasmodium gonderi]|uniref:Variable surface protein n=1 Tax=Plasmodium gonderi TaxID=77519 RepID=A0A1Y1JSQ6_PLAGO|nr:variable surface protein [Plasmodium gonderi]GAW84187.1 variable surface protein [Plasmodium gonderi]
MVSESMETFSESDFPSAKYYQRFNAGIRAAQRISNFCDDRSLSPIKNENVKAFCSLLINYLKHNYNLYNEDNYKLYHCNLLNFWLYEKLDNKFTSLDIHVNSIYSIFLKILQKVFSVDFLKFPYYCPFNDNIAKYDDWKEIKELYEYYVDRNHINNFYYNSDDNWDNICAYLKKKLNLYYRYKDSCKSPYKNECKLFHDTFKTHNELLLFNTFDCGQKGSEETSGIVGLFEEPDLSVQSGLNDQKGLRDKTYEASLEVKNNYRDPLRVTISSDEVEFTNKSSSALNIFVKVILGVLLTSLTLGLLCRFTSLGCIARDYFRMIKKLTNNPNEEIDGLFYNSLGNSSHFYEDRKKYYIGYITE